MSGEASRVRCLGPCSRCAFEEACRPHIERIIMEHAQHGRNGLVITKSPVRADIIVWNYPGGSAADHTTMFGEWEEGRTIFSDIGGNEGSSGVVKADVNHRTYVRAFIHVK